MTFGSSEYHAWYRDYPLFSFWGVRHDRLFFDKSFSQKGEYAEYNLTSKAYIFMKRLGQDYKTIMLMASDERDELFEMEMKLIEEEKKQNDEAKSKHR